MPIALRFRRARTETVARAQIRRLIRLHVGAVSVERFHLRPEFINGKGKGLWALLRGF